MKKLILYTLILFLMSCRSTQEVDTSVYMDAKQPVDKRVEALLAQMTLEEKVGQMDMVTVWDRMDIMISVHGWRIWSLKNAINYKNCPNKPV